MSDTSSGSPRSSAKSSAKQGAKPRTRKKSGAGAAPASDGVLANLPRTRPQRSSARRAAARQATPETQAKPAPKAKPSRKRATAKKQPRAKLTAKPAQFTAKPAQDPAPRQGFEAESDQLSGPVQPPGGADLFASAAELAGELTKSGLSAGGRLIKDALARLPLN